MTLTIDDVVTHYILSSHPRNRAIVDIKNKKTGELRFIKIRHRLSKFYAVSLVDPLTFEVWAETQVKNASAKIKPIIIHQDNNKNDVIVELKDTSRICFEWSFTWEGEKYRWVRESRMSNSLECRAIRKTGDICVAQYLPRTLKDEYFGIFSLLGYNMLRCSMTRSRELELIILMSLMTLLDKSDDGGWKKDPIGKGVVQEGNGLYNGNNSSSNDNSNSSSTVVSSITYEDPIPKKEQKKKYKVELLNDQKLQLMLEKDVRRSQKQIQLDQKQKPLSAGNSPNNTPRGSPLPTPSTSTNNVRPSPRLTRQKSAGNLNHYATALTAPNTANSSNISFDATISPTFPTSSGNSNASGGRLSRLFSNLSHTKQTNIPSAVTAATAKRPQKTVQQTVTSNINNINNDNVLADVKYQNKISKHQQHQRLPQNDDTCPYYDYHPQHSFTTGQLSRVTNEFGNMSIKNDNPPSLRDIRWNPEPIQTNGPLIVNTSKPLSRQQSLINVQHIYRSNSQDRRRPRASEEHQRRLSVSEYPIYSYHHQQQQNYGYNNISPQQVPNNYNNRYSSADYYAYYQQYYDHY